MKSCATIFAILMVASVAVADTVLDVDFQGLTPGAIGTGGAAMGEPNQVSNCDAIIVDGVLATRCLMIDDIADFGTGTVQFEFLGDSEATSGIVEISMNLMFSELEGYVFYVREHGGSADQFNTITFTSAGDVSCRDEAGSVGNIGTYNPGITHSLHIIHDMDAGTYDVLWDDALVIDDRAHGLTGTGIGRVILGVDHDVDLNGSVYVDDILVTATGIVGNEDTTWSAVKSDWR